MADFKAQIFQIATKNVHRNITAGMSNMAIIINSRPTDIHPDFAGIYGFKRIFFLGKGIV
jgi:hypothetical protein